jgi:hypothetical protein
MYYVPVSISIIDLYYISSLSLFDCTVRYKLTVWYQNPKKYSAPLRMKSAAAGDTGPVPFASQPLFLRSTGGVQVSEDSSELAALQR